MKKTRLVLCVLVFFVGVLTANADVYDLRTDWSDSSNPNGSWSYNQSDGTVITVNANISDSWLDTWTSGTQMGWQYNGGYPVWFKATTDGTDMPNGPNDWLIGDIVTHTDSSVSWTASQDGLIDISGSMWHPRDFGRVDPWNLRVGGSVVDFGNVTDSTDRSNRDSFNITGLAVLAGDVVSLELLGNDYVGVDLMIDTGDLVPVPVPVPAAFLLGMIGLSVAGVKLRRKSA